MNALGNNKLFYIVIALTIGLVAVGFGGNLLVDKLANRVIQKLQKEYSPSPYGPGIDPDRIDMDAVRRQAPPKNNQPSPKTSNWEEKWEKDRY